MLAACSNEGEPNVPVVEEEFEGIVLNIPVSRSSETRATTAEAPSNDEAAIHTLWVFAYAQGGKGADYIDQIAVPNDWSTAYPIVDNYKAVPVKLMSGEYHIYVLANIAASDVKKSDGSNMDTDMTEWSETDLQAAKLTSPLTPGGIPTNGIPMSCDFDEIEQNKTDKFTNNLGKIGKGESVSVYAPLTFCMAKVRFTMLNGVNKDIRMNSDAPLAVADYASVVGLMSQLTGPDTADDAATISTGDYFNYPVGENQSDAEWEPTELSNKDNTDTKWAYQAVFYIPEHVFGSSTDAKKSTLQVKFCENASGINKDVVLGEDNLVLRSHFYDYFGYIGKKEVTLQARVKEWGYFQHSIDLEDL